MTDEHSRLFISSLEFTSPAPSPVVKDKRSVLYFKGKPRVKIILLFLLFLKQEP